MSPSVGPWGQVILAPAKPSDCDGEGRGGEEGEGGGCVGRGGRRGGEGRGGEEEGRGRGDRVYWVRGDSVQRGGGGGGGGG